MKDRVIVNVSLGDNYLCMQQDIGHALARTDFDLHQPARMFYRNLPPGCPPHYEQMYAFKIYAIAEAIRLGYRRILWMDSTFCPTGPMDALWDAVARDGWYCPIQGDAVLGDWCSDRGLEAMGIDRTAARQIPLVYSGLVGLDMHSVTGVAIWHTWQELYKGHVFNGPHINKSCHPMVEMGNKWEGHCSHDRSVKGHRHDEAALSFVLQKFGLRPEAKGFLKLESPSGFIGRTFEEYPTI